MSLKEIFGEWNAPIPASLPLPVDQGGLGNKTGDVSERNIATATISRTAAAWVADLMRPGADLRALGFIGDGNSHPLSSVYSTLSAAQAVFPRATSLSEEIDGHCIQRRIDDQAPNGAKGTLIELPPYTRALTSFPMRSGAGPMTLIGNSSVIVQTVAGQDCWHHGTADTGYPALYRARFSLTGVTLECVGVGGTTFAVDMAPSSGGWVMRDVVAYGQGNQTTNYWSKFARGTGCSGLKWDNVRVTGSNQGNILSMQDCCTFTNDNTKFPGAGSYVYEFNRCDFNWYNWAVTILVDTGPLEGGWFTGCNINKCFGGIRISRINTTSSYRAPQWYFLDNQIEVFGTAYSINGCKFVRIRGGLLIIDPPSSYAAVPDYSADVISIGDKCFDVNIQDMSIELLPGFKARYIFNLEGAAGYVNIINRNRLTVDSGADATASINFGAQLDTGCVEHGNSGFDTTSFPTAVGDAYMASGTTYRTSVNTFSQAAILRAIQGSAGTFSQAVVGADGTVSIAGSRATTLTSGGSMAITFPAGLFATAPRVSAYNGDSSANAGATNGPEAVAVNASSITNTGFSATFVNAPNTSPTRRLSWGAVGR